MYHEVGLGLYGAGAVVVVVVVVLAVVLYVVDANDDAVNAVRPGEGLNEGRRGGLYGTGAGDIERDCIRGE
jgi:hypothetical protein